jgi:hypothetical protein
MDVYIKFIQTDTLSRSVIFGLESYPRIVVSVAKAFENNENINVFYDIETVYDKETRDFMPYQVGVKV